ncbi:MAG: prolipoprotein diacylglyceryl transferase [Bacilli bacterium]|jgi:phosphatidylglycerol:prolipoprotein diacylglycerol transferase|nr:prolipoprotein diacylglyceryl transferase [Bacilli bacterium]
MFSEKGIHLGPFTIAYYALCILVGALICYFLIRREWIKKGYEAKHIDDFFVYALLIGVLGARIWYVLFQLPMYLKYPSEMIMIWHGGLAIQGGLIAGCIFGYFYFKKRGYDFWDCADTILPYVLIAQACGRWGNFFNQEAYGGVVNVLTLEKFHIPQFIIDKMFIDGAYHHPTFLYESIYCLIIFVIIRLIIRYTPLKVGQAALLYGIFYSLGRIVIEGMRTDSLMIGPIRTAQLVSLIVIVVGVILFYRFDKKHSMNKLQEKRIKNGK